MNNNNRLGNVNSPPLPTSENHSYVNLNLAHTGARLPSYNESNMSPRNSAGTRPSPKPIPNSRKSLEINANINQPSLMPDNWYSPPSSVRSVSRPVSVTDPKAINFKNFGKNNVKTSRPTSVASSIYQELPLQKKLNTIDEDPPMLQVEQLLHLCSFVDNDDIQANAFGYLQHLTFNNPEIKMEVKEYDGLKVIIDNIDSDNNYVARGALGVLKNMAYTDFEMITNDIAKHNGIQKLTNIIDTTNDNTQKELAIDVLWNLSVKYNLKPYILSLVIQVLMNSVVIPDSRMLRQEQGNYVQGDEDIVWSTMLRNALGIIRNVSYEGSEARSTLRKVDGLIDCILYIIFQSGNRQDDEEEENQMALIDTKIVENCVCILRNLTYAIQEIVDPEYLEKRRDLEQKSKKSSKNKNNANQRSVIAPPPVSGVSKGAELLWNSKYIVTALFPILKNGANAVTLEAAAGVTQNLTAGDWEPSTEMQMQFRLQLALPSLIELVDFGTNEVIRSSATALRNLVQENFCRMLVGKNGLQNLIEKIPMSTVSKKIDPTALAALLSTIYVIIVDDLEFMKNFINFNGVHRCIYIKDSDEFLINDESFPDKVKVFSQCILDLLWKTSETQEMLKRINIKQSDIYNTNSKTSGGLNSNSPDNNRRLHDSIASDGTDRGAHFPTDERYLRDSLADIVSNTGLRDRNSKAYTINSIPGYGDVRLHAAGPKPNGGLATIQSGSRITSIASNQNGRNAPVVSKRISASASSYHPSRIVSPIPMKPIHGKVSVDARRASNNLSNHQDSMGNSKSSPRPLPNPRKSGDRRSASTNNSEVYNYEYSKPIKTRPIATNNVQTKRISNNGI